MTAPSSPLGIWPESILQRFNRIPETTTIENPYFGAYNLILVRQCFYEDKYTVEPQYALLDALDDRVDGFISFVVTVKDVPVLFLEIKPPGHIRSFAARTKADDQMRARFMSLRHMVKTPRLHGICAMGTQITLYTLLVDQNRVFPPFIQRDPSIIVDAAPEHWWNTDIMTQAGYDQFRAVVRDVKNMVNVM
jgi:hypothetical protein